MAPVWNQWNFGRGRNGSLGAMGNNMRQIGQPMPTMGMPSQQTNPYPMQAGGSSTFDEGAYSRQNPVNPGWANPVGGGGGSWLGGSNNGVETPSGQQPWMPPGAQWSGNPNGGPGYGGGQQYGQQSFAPIQQALMRMLQGGGQGAGAGSSVASPGQSWLDQLRAVPQQSAAPAQAASGNMMRSGTLGALAGRY